MNWLVFHIVSGEAFFTGIAAAITAIAASTASAPALRRLAVPLFLFGTVAIVLSSTAIPYWYYGMMAVAVLTFLVSRFRSKLRRTTAVALASTWAAAAAIELPYHLVPSLAEASDRSITIIGDSVTAGMGGEDQSETWPKILVREHQLIVQDISHVGDTAASALKRVRDRGVHSSLVFVEIGGNDVLGSTTSTQFARDLDALLSELEGSDRQIMMFELPLPPFYHEYGRIQRLCAAKHHVKLIPKRLFLSVVANSNSTLDSIHLSQAGHKKMAHEVWELVKAAFPGR